MTAPRFIRKSLALLFTAGATLSIGLLSFAGMFVLTASFVWCSIAFVLAAAYESQINKEGISIALKRIFDPHYSALRVIEDHLDSLENPDDIFLQDYNRLKKYIKTLNDDIHELHERKHSYLPFFESAERKKIQLEMSARKQDRKATKNELRALKLFLLKKISSESESVRKKIFHKGLWIKAGWLLSLGAGISSGFATLGSMKAALAVFPVLATVPVAAMTALAIIAGAGYAFLMYQNISDMVQKYKSTWKNYFLIREQESYLRHGLRIAGTIIAIGLGIFATIATAGTWWYAMKKGADILGTTCTLENLIRFISTPLMVVPTLIYTAQNSIASVDKISKSKFRQIFNDICGAVYRTLDNENTLTFVNPFRLASVMLFCTAKPIMFLGHIISIGLMSDTLPPLKPEQAAVFGATSEALCDANYLPDDGHKHESLLLSALFLPITLATGILNIFASMWDYTFSSERNLKNSFKKMFYSAEQPAHQKAVLQKPVLSHDWRTQQLTDTCKSIRDRLANKDPQKALAAINVLNQVKDAKDSSDLNAENLRKMAKPLARNRNCLWQAPVTKSEEDMNLAFSRYFATSPPCA